MSCHSLSMDIVVFHKAQTKTIKVLITFYNFSFILRVNLLYLNCQLSVLPTRTLLL